MRSLIYTTVFAVIVIFVFSQARVSSYTSSPPAPVVSQGSLAVPEVSTKPLPVEQWDAF